MYFSIIILSLIVTTVTASDPCNFGLISHGGKSGQVGQLPDGQNRLGGGYSQAIYTMEDGAITDSSGKGCVITPGVQQFQCDQGAEPTRGFSISENGILSHDGSPEFYACPASYSEYNLYTSPVAGQAKCVGISLVASNCYAPSQPSYGYTPLCPVCTPTTVTVIQTVYPTKAHYGYQHDHPYKPKPTGRYKHHKGGYYGPPAYKKPKYGHKYGHDNYGHKYGHKYGPPKKAYPPYYAHKYPYAKSQQDSNAENSKNGGDSNAQDKKPENSQEAVQILPFLTLSPFAVTSIPTSEPSKHEPNKSFENSVRPSTTQSLVT
ncbi:putative gpi anchored cell wall protein [Golovinomyces cichoracearum]|uniref:Putative gpi anchored cell wall protein n=1 Tax=Golovinomyces cichoracearum TaxID=62708 RepID=A0A420IPH2_9PEZI|nr:putative gpi anchored cell wall protein [Golovinomyces cichoracearum]